MATWLYFARNIPCLDQERKKRILLKVSILVWKLFLFLFVDVYVGEDKRSKAQSMIISPPASNFIVQKETCEILLFKYLRCRYLSWDDYFMAIAFLSAERSKDPNRQV